MSSGLAGVNTWELFLFLLFQFSFSLFFSFSLSFLLSVMSTLQTDTAQLLSPLYKHLRCTLC